jgi:hypothetical protein
MDPKTLHKHLAEAEAQVAQGLRHVADQRDVVEQLERDGHDSTTARDLLVTLLRSQQLHEEHRDRLKRELGVG